MKRFRGDPIFRRSLQCVILGPPEITGVSQDPPRLLQTQFISAPGIRIDPNTDDPTHNSDRFSAMSIIYMSGHNKIQYPRFEVKWVAFRLLKFAAECPNTKFKHSCDVKTKLPTYAVSCIDIIIGLQQIWSWQNSIIGPIDLYGPFLSSSLGREEFLWHLT